MIFGMTLKRVSFKSSYNLNDFKAMTSKYLKYVELRGFLGQINEVELVHFLKYVNSLKHITFNPRTWQMV